MADQSVNLTVSDPASATVREVAQSITSVMNFLCTPEGQITVRTWRENSANFEAGIEKAGAWIDAQLGALFK
jgi:hypothetical protein